MLRDGKRVLREGGGERGGEGVVALRSSKVGFDATNKCRHSVRQKQSSLSFICMLLPPNEHGLQHNKRSK